LGSYVAYLLIPAVPTSSNVFSRIAPFGAEK
jgi:hypothetical protein